VHLCCLSSQRSAIDDRLCLLCGWNAALVVILFLWLRFRSWICSLVCWIQLKPWSMHHSCWAGLLFSASPPSFLPRTANRHSRCMHSSHKSVSEHWLSEEENQTDRQTDRGTVESKKDDNTTSMPMHPLFCLKTRRIVLT